MTGTVKQNNSKSTRIIRRNAISNFVGRSWNALLSLVFIPVYIRLLGAESYGLVGFSVSLQMMVSLLEMGLATTATKEIARLSAKNHPRWMKDRADLMRTLEVIYFAIALVAGTLIFINAEALAVRWFHPRQLFIKEIKRAIVIMGWLIAARMPFSLYSGALMGLQKHVLLNGIMVAMVTLKHAGAVFALYFISSEVIVFFVWCLIIEVLQTAVTGYLFWKKLVISSYRAGFKIEQVKKIWRFASAVSLIGATNVALSQADKLFVSKVFSLETFGYYSAVSTLAGALYFLTYPVITALFPRYAQLFSQNAKKELLELYRKSGKVLSALLLPCGIIFLTFSEEILSIWLPEAKQVKVLSGVFRIIVISVILNSLFNLPMNLQLASGWTSLIIYSNLMWLLILPLAMWQLSVSMGVLGVPIAWMLYNLFCFTAVAYLAHRRLLYQMRIRNFVFDIATPLAAAGTVAVLAYMLFPYPKGIIEKCIMLGTVFLLAETASILTIREFRFTILQYVKKLYK
ncbi:MAG: oligosaccharide flippase family protein [Deltaproteobacteria bacterium]|nr:oligosaccharide flippase family protein [Deltaproteobacteria bacterium]MBW1959848.1 oligosaccharide flippase family protein [Deltaproteobacteria bacterium]MBW2150362.1 oligosaccharide flippase family protein [Deltaproteobacteria bacterium]